MNPAEIRFIRKVFTKEKGAKVFRKIRPSPFLWESFKATAPPRTAAGYLETKCQHWNENSWRRSQRRGCDGLFCRLCSNWINIAIGIIVQFPLGRSSLRRCQNRGGVNSGVANIGGGVHCAVANIVEEFIAPLPTENNNILGFKCSWHKWQQLSNLFIAPLPTAVCSNERPRKELCAPLAIRSHRMGDRRIFLKTSAPLSFIKAFRMNIISAGSISLDSTFKKIEDQFKIPFMKAKKYMLVCLKIAVVTLTRPGLWRKVPRSRRRGHWKRNFDLVTRSLNNIKNIIELQLWVQLVNCHHCFTFTNPYYKRVSLVIQFWKIFNRKTFKKYINNIEWWNKAAPTHYIRYV